MSYAETMRAVLTNPDSQESEKQEAIASLRRLADVGNDSAKIVLADLCLTGDGQPASTENVGEVSTETVSQDSASSKTIEEALGDSDDLSAMFARWQASPKSRGNPQINHWVETCEKEAQRSNIYRYWLPNLYQVAPAAGTRLRQTFAKYLPYKWLTWELFNEIQHAVRPDPTKTCFEQTPIATRVAPHIDRWRAIKKDWEAKNGPTGECLVDVLYDPATDHPEYERQPVAAK